MFLFQSILGWVCGGKVTTETELVSETSLFVSTIDVAPTSIPLTTHMLTSVDSPIAVKPSIELFWNLESLGITESPSVSDDDIALDHFNKAVKFVDG